MFTALAEYNDQDHSISDSDFKEDFVDDGNKDPSGGITNPHRVEQPIGIKILCMVAERRLTQTLPLLWHDGQSAVGHHKGGYTGPGSKLGAVDRLHQGRRRYVAGADHSPGRCGVGPYGAH